MASFATPQRLARKAADFIAAPLVAAERVLAAGIPTVQPSRSEPLARGKHDVAAPRPLAPIPLFRPDARPALQRAPHPKQSPAPTMLASSEGVQHADTQEAAPEAVHGVVQARIAVKKAGPLTARERLNAGGTPPIQRKSITGLPDARKAGVAALSGVMLDTVRVRGNAPKAKPILQTKTGAMLGGAVIQRAYVGADAKEDVALFPKDPVADEAVDLSTSASAARAAALGITSINLKHYLNRHTFKYQPLTSASTYPPQTGMFPIGTDKDAVKSMVIEAIGKVPAGKTVTADIESVSVDLANGLKVNLGALAGNKLQAFFPQSGTGFHSYTNVELQAIKAEKDALEAPAKALAAKALKDKKDKQAAEKAEKAAKNKAFLAAKAAKAATPPPATTPVVASSTPTPVKT